MNEGRVVLTVPDLVDSLLLFPIEPPIFVHSILLEEIPDLVSRGQEVLISDMIPIARCELRLLSKNNDG